MCSAAAALSAPPLPRLAACRLDAPSDGPPEWVQLVPAGKVVHAKDGRKFKNLDPQAVVEAFAKSHTDIPLDWEHATEIRAPEGKPSPAAGWITALEVRDGGSIWGKVDWTEKGAASVTSREYRYISPAFTHSKTGNIEEIVSAGLTNRPALRLPELASSQGAIMDPTILEMLGLPEGATPEEVAAAIKALQEAATKAKRELAALEEEKEKAEAAEEDDKERETAAEDDDKEKDMASRRAIPSLEKFVPRADYDAALARVKAIEERLAKAAEEKLDAEISAEIEAALKAGKITPATKDHYVSVCRLKGGLEIFRSFVKDAPVVVEPGEVIKQRKAPGARPALTSVERKAMRDMGITEAEYFAELEAEAEA